MRLRLLFFLGFLFLLAPARAAQFSIGALIRVGVNGNSAGAWELAAGPSSGSPGVVGNANNFNNDVPRSFTIEYTRSTNSVAVTLAPNGGGPLDSVTYSIGGPAPTAVNATWTLPASSFLLTALGPNLGRDPAGSSITLSGLSLSGVTGAINILSPLQQTTLTASRTFTQGTVTTSESQDVVFQGDANGNWRLTGTVTVSGLGGSNGVSGNDLTFGLDASASDTPEPASIVLSALGLIVIGWFQTRVGMKNGKRRMAYAGLSGASY